MSAFIDLAKFCGDHPEIRAHKMVGELLRAADAELEATITQNEAFRQANDELRKGWNDCYETNQELRAENKKLCALLAEKYEIYLQNCAEIDRLSKERQEAREHLERLLEATEDFLALPPDDMKDFMPCSQPTTASDCRLLTAAHRMASEWMQKESKNDTTE